MSKPGTRWDPEQYDRFKRERSQPFHDLIGRIPAIDARAIADLGCGDGELTRLLLDRWPEAEVTGVDSSSDMLERARARPAPPKLRFVKEDLGRWRPDAPLDLVVSNAALQWIPDHAGLLRSLRDLLAPSGILAVQVPKNYDETAYRMATGLMAEPPWNERARHASSVGSVEPAEFYREHLARLGFEADVWETVYEHRMESADGIVEWLKGALLRPILTELSDSEAAGFLAALSARIGAAYVAGPRGVVFPFRRLFFVARREK